MSRHSHFTDERAPMRYGHFDDAAKEYVIVTPATPLPWINYLGNEDFFSLISNTDGGYSFYKAPSCAASPATATTTCRVKNVPIPNASMRLFTVISLSNLLLIGTQPWYSIPHASLLSGLPPYTAICFPSISPHRNGNRIAGVPCHFCCF